MRHGTVLSVTDYYITTLLRTPHFYTLSNKVTYIYICDTAKTKLYDLL